MINNVVYDSKDLVTFRGDYAQFKTVNNYVADQNPGFIDMESCDLRLKGDSIVFEKIPGVEPIPFEMISLYSDQYRPVIEK